MPTVAGLQLDPGMMAQIAARNAQPQERPGILDFLKSGAIGAYGGLRYGVPYAVEQLAGTATAADDQFYQAWLAEKARQAEAAAPGGPAGFSDLTSGRAGLGDVVFENLAFSAPHIASTVVGAFAGGIPGAVAAGTPLFVGSNVQRAAEDGPLTTEEAGLSLAVAPGQAALDAVVGRFVPGLRGKLGGAAQESVRTGVTGFAERTGKSMLKAAVTEAVTETGQQVGERAAAGLSLSNQEALGEFTEAFLTAAIVGGAMGSFGGIGRANPSEVPTEEIGNQVDQMLGLPAPQGPAGLLASPARTELDLEVTRAPEIGPEALPAPEGGPTTFVTPEGTAIEGNAQQAAVQAELQRTAAGDLRATLERIQDTPEAETLAPLIESELLRRESTGAQAQNEIRQLDFPALQQRLDAVDDSTRAEEVQALEEAFQARLTETKRGLSNSFTKKLEAASYGELIEKVYDQVFTKQDQRPTTQKLAQRLGILDNDLNPTSLARQVEATKAATTGADLTPAAEVRPERDPDFEVEAKKLTSRFGYKNAQGTSKEQFDRMNYVLDARTPEELDARIFERLADDQEGRSNTAKATTRLERLARERGLLDRELNLTDKGREVAVNAGIPAEERLQAAIDQGFTGSSVSMFERGVLAPQGELPQGGLTQDELKAYVAGQKYSRDVAPKVATNRETQEIVEGFAPGARLPDTVQEQADLMGALDTLPVGKDVEKAKIRDLIQSGKTQEARQALDNVAAGGSLFAEPQRAPVNFRGEVVTPGARTRESRRRRAVQQARDERFVNSRRGPTRNQQREQTKKLLQGEIEAAFASEDISAVDRVRLIDKLRQNDFGAVIRGLPGFTSAKVNQAFKLTDAEKADMRRIDNELRGKDFWGALDVAIANAPSARAKAYAKLLKSTLREYQRLSGADVEFQVVRGVYPENWVRGAVGLAELESNDGKQLLRVSVLTGNTLGTGGTDFDTIVHEFTHAATMASIVVGQLNPRSEIGKLVTRLTEVQQELERHLEGRRQQGNMTQLESNVWRSNALTDPHELVAWGLTNPEFQAYLDTVQLPQAQTLWSKFTDLVRRLLRMPRTQQTYLEEVMRLAEQLLARADVGALTTFSDGLVEETTQGVTTESPKVVDMNAATQQAAQRAQATVDSLIERAQRTGVSGLKDALRNGAVGFMTVFHLSEQYGGVLPALKTYYQAHLHRGATQARFAKLFESVYQRYDKVRVRNKTSADRIQRLMEFTINEIDPRKDWAAHTHLHDRANKAELAKEVRSANNMYRDLRNDGNTQIYEELVALNEVLQLASSTVAIRNLVLADKELAAEMGDQFTNDPMAEFRDNSQRHESPIEARDYWAQTLDQQLEFTKAFITKLRGDGTKTAVTKRLNPIETMMRQVRNMRTNMDRAPYFHLGRVGSHFVSFAARMNDQKIADPAAVAQIEKRLAEAGFNHARLSTVNQNPTVYITVENQQARLQLAALAEQMKRDGLLDPDTDVKDGKRGSDSDSGLYRDTPEHLQAILGLIEQNDMFDMTGLSDKDKAALQAQKNHILAQARELWLDLLPDSSLSKVLAPRKGVQGFDTDMMRNMAHRFEIGALAITGLSSMVEVNGSVSEMRQAVRDAAGKRGTEVDLISGLTSEILKREGVRAQVEDSSHVFDKMRAGAHAYFLGASISYGAINMTQIGVLLWPELAKRKGGFVGGARAIGKVTPTAFKIMVAVFAEARKHGWQRWGDVSITADVLKKAGLDDKTAVFVTQMVASGIIDIGGAARELGRISEGQIGTTSDTVLRLAGGIGLYTETMTRLIAALSAREMNGGDNSVATREYARQVVNETMLNYSNWNTARELGKAGKLGAATPVVTQFMQYSVQLMEKLYREFYRALPNTGSTAVQKAEARRFLGAHLAGVTTVAGTLGLPFAAVAARTAELLVDLFDDDDEPYDATAAYRRLLAGAFGKDVGEVISRGAFRAVGVDIAQRAGEQNLLPFTKVITDKRGIVEGGKAWLSDNATGAAGGMIGSFYGGVLELADGDVLGAFATGAPLALRGIAKAGVMTRDGYVDSRGNVLPLDPEASDYLAQILGFSPAERAEYSEERQAQTERRGVLNRRAAELRDKITKAVLEGDADTFRAAVARARKFDSDNPAYSVLPDIEGAVRRRLRNEAFSRSTRLPLGVSPRDLEARELTGYGNY